MLANSLSHKLYNGLQMVILAGGLGTRLRPLMANRPKSVIEVKGKPFLQYQIELLTRSGVDDIVLCIGYLGQQIKDYFGDGTQFSVRIRYSEEGERLLGTGGALKKAEDLLGKEFFLMWGDSYLMLDYAEIMAYFKRHDKLALMVVYKNFNRYQPSNVAVDGNLVVKYDKRNPTSEMIYIDEGLSVFRREVLDLIPNNRAVSLEEEIFPELIARREMLALETQQRFFEIGSFEGLKEFTEFIASGRNVP